MCNGAGTQAFVYFPIPVLFCSDSDNEFEKLFGGPMHKEIHYEGDVAQ